MKTCTICDERGMIQDNTDNSYYSAHSCPCGKNIRITEEMFKDISLGELIAYKEMRTKQKMGANYPNNFISSQEEAINE